MSNIFDVLLIFWLFLDIFYNFQ